MRGKKPDPDLREPMRWNRAADASGKTTWKASTSHDGPAVSVEAEQADPDSLLHYYTMLIHWRSQLGVLRDGAIHEHATDNPHIAAWQLDDADSQVLVAHNLSGQQQSMSLGDARFRTVLLHSKPGVTLQNGRLLMPAYTTVILQ